MQSPRMLEYDHCLEAGLPSSEADIWVLSLDRAVQHFTDWEELLSPAEIARANRFRQPADRFSYGVTRAIIRRLLSRYAKTSPTEIQFNYNPYGKPSIAPATILNRLRFNVSHSGNYAIFGVTHGRAIGVDIEANNQSRDYQDLPDAICSERELRQIASLPAEKRNTELLRYWTLKEAYLKALGVGLSFSHKRVEIAPRQPSASDSNGELSLRIRGPWSVFPLYDQPEYVAAVVISGAKIKLRNWGSDWLGDGQA